MDTHPITGVKIITAIANCPKTYICIAKTTDTNEEADFGREGIFSKSSRYICISRKTNDLKDNSVKQVLTDIIFIGERDNPPTGYMSIATTFDTKERAFKKRTLCVQTKPRHEVAGAIIDIVVVRKKPPNGFTASQDVNYLYLCYKIGTITLLKNKNKQQAPLSTTAVVPPPQVQRHQSVIVNSFISGVQFSLNKRFTTTGVCGKNSLVPHYTALYERCLSTLENNFYVDFRVENSVLG
jgi:hypothetical protein